MFLARVLAVPLASADLPVVEDSPHARGGVEAPAASASATTRDACATANREAPARDDAATPDGAEAPSGSMDTTSKPACPATSDTREAIPAPAGLIGAKRAATLDASTTLTGLDPILLGAMERAVVDEVIDARKAAIRACYEQALPNAPTLAGKVIVKFVIASDGTVSSAVTKRSDLGRPDVEDCIVNVVFQARFSPPTGGGIVIVSYPFLFSPD